MNPESMLVVSSELVATSHARMMDMLDHEELVKTASFSNPESATTFATALEESLQTLRLLIGLEFPKGARVLEVGAGYGLASICLALMGFQVTALEPGGTGFEENSQISRFLIARCGVEISHIDESAEVTDLSSTPGFDLIVSNNVLEHIPDVDAAMTNLAGALVDGGLMIHSCANYAFPFEPHFGIPLIPVFPHLTSVLLPKRIKTHGVWLSLNFVTARRVKRNAIRNGLVCSFRRGTMASSIKRLTVDERFAERHESLARLVRKKQVAAVVTRFLSIPVMLATPMDFVIHKSGGEVNASVNTWLQNR